MGCNYLAAFVLQCRWPANLQKTPTTTGKFEVTVNGKLVHSKANGEGFPDAAKVQKIIDEINALLK
jgi:selT/selW/selH-like putative selenoprotein